MCTYVRGWFFCNFAKSIGFEETIVSGENLTNGRFTRRSYDLGDVDVYESSGVIVSVLDLSYHRHRPAQPRIVSTHTPTHKLYLYVPLTNVRHLRACQRTELRDHDNLNS